MPSKATRVICNFEPDTPVTLSLSPLAIEDLTDTPCYALTPNGRAEVASMDAVPLTGLLKQRLEQFRAARHCREQARGEELLKAMKAEDEAALLLAWTLDQDSEVSSC